MNCAKLISCFISYFARAHDVCFLTVDFITNSRYFKNNLCFLSNFANSFQSAVHSAYANLDSADGRAPH